MRKNAAMKMIAPSVFLCGVTPLYIALPPCEYSRPIPGKYLAKISDNGNQTYAQRANNALLAARTSGSRYLRFLPNISLVSDANIHTAGARCTVASLRIRTHLEQSFS